MLPPVLVKIKFVAETLLFEVSDPEVVRFSVFAVPVHVRATEPVLATKSCPAPCSDRLAVTVFNGAEADMPRFVPFSDTCGAVIVAVGDSAVMDPVLVTLTLVTAARLPRATPLESITVRVLPAPMTEAVKLEKLPLSDKEPVFVRKTLFAVTVMLPVSTLKACAAVPMSPPVAVKLMVGAVRVAPAA